MTINETIAAVRPLDQQIMEKAKQAKPTASPTIQTAVCTLYFIRLRTATVR